VAVDDGSEAVDCELRKAMSSSSRSPQTSDSWVPELAAELQRRQQALLDKEQALEQLRKENEKLRANAESGWNAAQIFYHALHTRTEDTASEVDMAVTSNVYDHVASETKPLEPSVVKTDEEDSLSLKAQADVERSVRLEEAHAEENVSPSSESSCPASSMANGSVDSGQSTTPAVSSPSLEVRDTDNSFGTSSRKTRSPRTKSMVAQICADFENRLHQIWDGTENGNLALRPPLVENSSQLHGGFYRKPSLAGNRISSLKPECGSQGNEQGTAQQQNLSLRGPSAGFTPAARESREEKQSCG
jgi:hypothetical protein